jgi:hypothetical protein
VKETYPLSVVNNVIRKRYQFKSCRRIGIGSTLVLGISPAILYISLLATRTPRVVLGGSTGIRILSAKVGLLNGEMNVSICCTLQVGLLVELVVKEEIVELEE